MSATSPRSPPLRATISGTSKTSYMERLSDELVVMILKLLRAPNLRHLSQTCRSLHTLGLSILFQRVDLSLHNQNLSLHRPHEFTPICKKLRIRQYLFVQQLLQTPHYATHIRTFFWTMAGSANPWWTRFEYAGKEVTLSSDEIYRMFSLLQEVTYVDIDTGYTHRSGPTVLPSLFPQAKHIRLGGKMHYAFASAILHGPGKAPLDYLELNNVQEGGLLESGANFRWVGHIDLANFEEIWPEGHLPIQVVPGTMRRLMTPEFQLRCTNLRTLSLRKQGQQMDAVGYFPSHLTHEDDVYQEWAAFIDKIRPQYISFANLGRDEWPYNGSEEPRSCGLRLGHVVRLPDVAPMDLRFQRFLWPLLRDGWKNLKLVSIFGVSEKVLLDRVHGAGNHDLIVDERLGYCENGVVGGH
jgi:hypothetical protein